MTDHELVVRGATVVDGTGRPGRVADVAVDGERITDIGPAAGKGRREFDGDGLVCMPGFVDVHTHYDGQALWDPELTPSSWHGVTTVVTGNCGVGFAPLRPGGEQFLVEVMEGVEDIPGTALHEGLDWSWESFPDFLDALDRDAKVADLAALVPHAALRAYVLGERAHEDSTVEEAAEMARLVGGALAAGAVGFSTSRTMIHRSKHGPMPGTTAPAVELLMIAEAMTKAGHGVFQLISDGMAEPEERAWIVEVAQMTKGTVTYSMAQTPNDRLGYKALLDDAEALAAEGLKLVPQVPSRPTGMLFGLESSLHPFITHPTYRTLAKLPLAERVLRLRQPDVQAALLAEKPSTGNPVAKFLMSRYDQIFPLGDPPNYEPAPEASVAAEAARSGRTPDAVALEWLLGNDGRALLFAPLSSYVDGDHEAIREMMVHPRSILGLGDGGAHCGLICDASMTTTVLTHWVRDRVRGERLSLERAVELLARPAAAYGFHDRGTIEVGKRADLNLVDMAGLRLHPPTMAYDLPAGGRRLVQRADGYVATIAGGQVTFEHGEATGARPGRLVRF